MQRSIHISYTDTGPQRQQIISPTRVKSSKSAQRMTRSHYEVEDPTTLLLSWGSHSDESFHYFTNEEARNIRKALMIWYRKNRRKLPWRGDPPPFDGSTAGYSANNNQKKKVKIDKKV